MSKPTYAWITDRAGNQRYVRSHPGPVVQRISSEQSEAHAPAKPRASAPRKKPATKKPPKTDG